MNILRCIHPKSFAPSSGASTLAPPGAAIPNAERAMTTGIPVMRPGWTAANCPTAQTATHQESNGCLLDDLPKDWMGLFGGSWRNPP